MVAEWNDLRPDGVESDPQYLAALCRHALAQRRRHARADLRHAHLRADHARQRCAPSRRRCRRPRRSSSTAPPRRACSSWSAPPAGCTTTRATRTSSSSTPATGLSRVVVTTLGRTWMPLLRYDIGDLVRVADGCTCGRADEGYILARIEGRGNDAITTPRGLFTPAMLDDVVDAAEPTIAHWQLQAAGDAGLRPAIGRKRRQQGRRGARRETRYDGRTAHDHHDPARTERENIVWSARKADQPCPTISTKPTFRYFHKKSTACRSPTSTRRRRRRSRAR